MGNDYHRRKCDDYPRLPHSQWGSGTPARALGAVAASSATVGTVVVAAAVAAVVLVAEVVAASKECDVHFGLVDGHRGCCTADYALL